MKTEQLAVVGIQGWAAGLRPRLRFLMLSLPNPAVQV